MYQLKWLKNYKYIRIKIPVEILEASGKQLFKAMGQTFKTVNSSDSFDVC